MRILFLNNWNNFSDELDSDFKLDLLSFDFSKRAGYLFIGIINFEIRIYFKRKLKSSKTKLLGLWG